MFFQNWGGINTIIYYAPTLLKNVGFTDRQRHRRHADRDRGLHRLVRDLVGAGAVGDAARNCSRCGSGPARWCICTTLNWLFDLAVALLFPTLLAKFGAGPNFLFFALTTFLALIFAWRLLPETKGKSLEEIEQQLTFHADSDPAAAAG